MNFSDSEDYESYKDNDKSMKKTRFKEEWNTMFPWLVPEDSPQGKKCNLCNSSVNGGPAHIKRHESTEMHLKFAKSHNIQRRAGKPVAAKPLTPPATVAAKPVKKTPRKSADKSTERAQNKLSLEQRVKVIHEFDRNPSVLKLAVRFLCSETQIRNILASRETLLADYDAVMRLKELENRCGSESESGAFTSGCTCPHTPQCVDINDCVSRGKETECLQNNESSKRNLRSSNRDKRAKYSESPFDSDDNIRVVSEIEEENDYFGTIPQDESEEQVDYEDVEDSISIYSNVVVDLNVSSTTNNNNTKNFNNNAKAFASFPDVNTFEEALPHLKVLEDFAMIKENYRAIGLLTQVQQVLKNPGVPDK